MIERNAYAQVQIVEDLLDITRIVAGKLHLTKKSIPIVPIVEAAVDSIRTVARDKGVQVVTRIGEIPRPVEGDPDRLQQIIWNLLSNAVKFTPAPGRVEIFVEPVADHVNIQVSDTGIGLAPDLIPHIFNTFRRADGPTSVTRAGLGLGLAIVRHLVDLHSGDIHAASPGIGGGTVFTLRFPLQARKAASSTS
jgi:two-component system CheB/CheR fusion protein